MKIALPQVVQFHRGNRARRRVSKLLGVDEETAARLSLALDFRQIAVRFERVFHDFGRLNLLVVRFDLLMNCFLFLSINNA